MSVQPAAQPDLLASYAGQVRVRVSGILSNQSGTAVLLAAHRGLLPEGAPFWSPPGGGWHCGESLREALTREFREETGLAIRVGQLLYLHEFRNPAAGLQAVELFFAVEALLPAEAPLLGVDPEHAPGEQLLTALAWLTPAEWRALPASQVHPVVARCRTMAGLRRARPFFAR